MAGVWNRNLEGLSRASAIGFLEPGYATVYNTDGNVITSAKPSTSSSSLKRTWSTPLAMLTFVSGETPSSSGMAIRFGSGTQAPTANDYNLTTPVSPNYVSVDNGNYTYANGVAVRTVTVVVQNRNSGSMTIAEWGIFAFLTYNNTSNSFSGSPYVYPMIYHATLETPVTLAQYESATFTLTVSVTVAHEN